VRLNTKNLFDECAELCNVLLTSVHNGVTTVVGTALVCQLIRSSTFVVLYVEVRSTLQQSAASTYTVDNSNNSASDSVALTSN